VGLIDPSPSPIRARVQLRSKRMNRTVPLGLDFHQTHVTGFLPFKHFAAVILPLQAGTGPISREPKTAGE